MKRITLFSVIISFTINAFAQWEPWSEPVALTESTSYNANPVILVGNNFTYMFYEKRQEENSSTMIYYRDIENMSEEQAVFNNPEYEYRNPRILFTAYPSFLTLLIYETNTNGNFDIWARELYDDGSFGNTDQLTTTPENESSVYSSNYGVNLCWIAENKIYISDLSAEDDLIFLEEPFLIDSGEFKNPICNYWFSAYCKIENDSSHIFYAQKDFNPVHWSEPIPLDTTGNNVDICFLDNFGYEFDNIVFWGKSASIYYFKNNEINKLIIPGFEDAEVFEPTTVFYTIIVDYNPPGFISFSATENDNKDIFAYWMEEWAGYNVVNVSHNNLLNTNPRLLYGWSENDPCYVYLLDIWETHYSEGVNLNMSKTSLYVCGGVDEMKTDQSLQLKISPNPFTNQLNIDYYQTEDSPATLDFYSIHGNVIDQIVIENPEHGWNETKWIPGNKIPKGVYTIVLSQGSKKRTAKTIYQ